MKKSEALQAMRDGYKVRHAYYGEDAEYLNSLNKGAFKVTQTKCDNGDFCESFFVTRVTNEEVNKGTSE